MTWALIAFNLFVNAAFILLASLALAYGACALMRVERGRLRALLLSAPLFKAGYEIARGIPEQSFFWAKLSGARQELGSFQLGFGVQTPLIPVIDLQLGALSHGRDYPQSAADVLAGVLSRRVAAGLPAWLGALLCVLVALGVLRFAFEGWRGVRARRAILREARLVETRRMGILSVRIYVSESWQGVPFAAGVLRPWLCLPAQVERALSADEREAVIAHELAHLVHQDLLLLSATRFLAQALGFVPGARWLARQVQAQCELAADQRASRSVPPPMLASALVRVAELCRARDAVVAPLSFLHPGSALRERVELLLAPPAGRRPLWLRLLLGALALATLLRASFFANP
jgi:hypothetical protein